ncbi:MAG: nitrogenase molybdenum-iron cofactor biosynthesis protein [Candidatus Methanomethylicota archaeon]|jgi:nitrogen fixation protein NifB|uniref:FeMo cofactor biosynthesis protein NifB n=1 Tax=Thermoproteota archaeon TaxID=2056631 RepID=A0A520KGM1_9CREN|nr:MAG: radical SAM protein [Candidatus Verstraetearchaeota archaeon]TDA40428.1 MAG: nitrogenase molybdenum-iron cofactor biosynthesis protein [Candidatus Verstraetearchaeota archaeon]
MSKNPKWTGIGSKFSHFTSVHPCFGVKAHYRVARIHLPVAPKCNIQCNYCKRDINKCEWRPGVASCITDVNEAINRLEAEIKSNKDLKVVGIAGPGESLYNKETFEVLSIIKERWNWLIRCISTNGLLVEDKANELENLEIGTVTITINAIDPEVGAKIYEWVFYEGKILRGIEASKLLIEKQLRGIEELVKRGIVVRINTVLIPEINSNEIENIARECRDRGASLMNIIPLIPIYKFENLRRPTCDELKKARDLAEKYLPQFRLCKQCRADAIGIPGKEKISTYFHG